MNLIETNSSADIVIETTNSKVRTFLYELAEGTSNYRSLHSLTEQVEHQYHGRFIIELIQNAHDALFSSNDNGQSPARIEITLKDEGEFGTLYVANDGKPFSRSNFNSLSQLGQSDKNPQESIGNKGIGFRSVLEITHSPEIYSRSCSDSQFFDGFCFAFSLDVIHHLTAPILALLNGDDTPSSPFGHAPLVDWEAGLLMKFRAKVNQVAKTERMSANEWLSRELTYLSPYLLPFYKNSKEGGYTVAEYEGRGFATLIRFPLKNASTRELVREKLNELDDGALLFLEKITSLVLDSDGQRREIIRSQSTIPKSFLNGREVSISDLNKGKAQSYWVWSRNIALIDAPDDVQAALQQLPGKWPQLQDVSISIGVGLGEIPESGSLSIFLPTSLESGSATHINAPFFGDMSRTHIDFGSDDELNSTSGGIYNRYLLSEAARHAILVIQEELAGRGINEARAVVDLLAPWSFDQNTINRWQQLTRAAAAETETEIQTINWFLSDTGWSSLTDTSLLPIADDLLVLVPQVLREHATFSVYAEGLDSRRELVEELSVIYDIGPKPGWSDLANTVESIALEFHKKQNSDWNSFWSDVRHLFDGDCRELIGKRVMLGNDDQLHMGGSGECTVFFIPRRGSVDDEEVENDGDVKEIPLTLRPYVSFLSEKIHVYEEKNGRLQQTQVRKMLLDSKLVSRFRREDIINEVLLVRVPTLPVPLNSPYAELCRDILHWALILMAHLVESGKTEKSLKLLKGLPAPCKGGWYPLGETTFGPKWIGTKGDITQKYLALAKTPETKEARLRLLLPPSDARWTNNGALHISIIKQAGVFDGLRLIPINPKSWHGRIEASKNSFELPIYPPPVWSQNDWNEYRKVAHRIARPTYSSGIYDIQKLYAFPGLDKYPEFDEETRLAFMEVILGNIAHWEDGWDRLVINRIHGNSDFMQLMSPLFLSLSTLNWLGLESGELIEWSQPSQRWYVPALELARGRKWHFAHLKPLPSDLANRLDLDSSLAAIMKRLGTPHFNPESKSSSTQLLDALAETVKRNDVPHKDVFLGQVKSAWRGFEPKAGSSFPKTLLIQRGRSKLTAEIPNDKEFIYLPDSAKSFISALKHFELPVIAIETTDAKRLADRFTAEYSSRVVRASDLKPQPLVDGEYWSDSPQDLLRDDTELNWVIPVLLTMTAFFGTHAQGTISEPFRKLIEIFRNAKLSIVGKIEIGLFRNETPVAPPLPVPALWVSSSQVLLLSNGWKSDMASLSEAFSSLLDREEFEIPIKLILGTIGSHPEIKDIIHGLEQLKLTEAHFNEVREQWRGDLGKIIETLIPLLMILKPNVNIGKLVDLDTEESLLAYLVNLSDERFDGRAILQIAQELPDAFNFGCKVFEIFGDLVQLRNWNAALIRLDQKPLMNRYAPETFKMYLSTSVQVFRSLIAVLISRREEIGTFNALSEKLESISLPESFMTDFWRVSFNLAHSTFIPLLENWYATSGEIEAVRAAHSIEELISRLTDVGIDVTRDPIETARDNREKLRQALVRFQQIGLAWALESNYPNPADWESRLDGFIEFLSIEKEITAFTGVWDAEDVWTVIKRLPKDEPSAKFWANVENASSLEDLTLKLGLSNDSLFDATTKLAERREDAIRRKRVIDVCGKEFDGSEDNLSGLWGHICTGLPQVALDSIVPVDLQKLSNLANVASHMNSRRKDNTLSKSSKPIPKYISKSMESLVGLSGEIHAFRMLQNTYGVTAISASCWISSNSTYVFDGNEFNDGAGSDFLVTLKGITYYIEVKATEGENESFTMGSSEIRLAMKLAPKSRKKTKNVFVILRVSNALSVTPSFQLLPNPYDQKYQSHFVIEEADVRVKYRSRS